MDIETIRAKMAAQVSQASQSAMASVFGWVFEGQDLVVYATLRHRRRPESTYLLRVVFDEFPRRAPSYVFVDHETKQMTSGAWPPNVRHGAEPLGICTPGTREFHEHWHRGDAQHPWDPERYTFLATLQGIHRLMERGVGG